MVLPTFAPTVSQFTPVADAIAPFPVVCSTFCSEALGRHIQACYGFPSLLSCKLWIRGLSDVYLLETHEGLYVLRVTHARWRSEAEIAFELTFLDHLHNQGIPVAHPMQTPLGQLFVELVAPEGRRFASLSAFAPGEIPLCDLSLSQAGCLGQTLAQLHRASQGFSVPFHRPALTLETLLHDSLDRLIPCFSGQPEEQQYLQSLGLHLQTKLDPFPQDAPHWVVCWGDPHSGNVHFTQDRNGSHGLTLFDFDQCGYGWRAFDIAKFLQTSLRTGMSYAVRRAFVAGYESVSPLATWELESLADWVQVAHLWSWALRLNAVQVHSHSQFDQHYFNQRLHQLRSFGRQSWSLI